VVGDSFSIKKYILAINTKYRSLTNRPLREGKINCKKTFYTSLLKMCDPHEIIAVS